MGKKQKKTNKRLKGNTRVKTKEIPYTTKNAHLYRLPDYKGGKKIQIPFHMSKAEMLKTVTSTERLYIKAHRLRKSLQTKPQPLEGSLVPRVPLGT